MIKIFPVGNRIKTSPLTKEFGTKYLNSQGIIISTLSEAELIIAASWKGVLPLMFMYGKRKKFMIVTHEPRFDTHFDPILKYPLLPEVKVLNVYTGIYNNNYMYGPKQVNLTPLTNFEFKNHKLVALMGYRKNPREWSLKYKRKELDLCYLRTQIALEGHKMNILDVYGKDWPKDIKKGESRGRNWWNKKQAILQEYDFNLAFENTNWPYYCTEKIWDSIQGGCLPIYYGEGNAIYQDFPEDSFLDYCQFGNAQDLFRYIQSMTSQEFVKRMNLCIETFNTASNNREAISISVSNIELVVNKIREIFED